MRGQMSRMRKTAARAGLCIAMTFAFLLLLCGCGTDSDPKVIDFSNTVDVSRPDTSRPSSDALRVAVAAMVSPKESFVYYREFLDFLGDKLNKKIHLVQRKTYGEVNRLLGEGSIDIAFICSGPYAAAKEKYGFDLLAAPQVNGSHFYRAYLIVNTARPYERLEDLRGKTFAFTDRESNTGRLVPIYWLALMRQRPEAFFQESVFTYSHDNSILAVAKGLVDGAVVDGLVWDHFARTHPEVTSKTRIIRRSEPYGIPPLVASSSLSRSERDQIRNVILTAHQDPRGRKILDGLSIECFVEPREEWYDSIRAMIKHLALTHETRDDDEKPER